MSASRRRSVWLPVLVYALCATLWILLSDPLTAWLATDHEALILAGTLKGLAFVLVTSLLLHRLLRRERIANESLEATEAIGQAQAAHLRALNIMAAIANSSQDAIFAQDLEGRFILFNQAAERTSGKTAEEALGRDESALFPPEMAARLTAQNREVLDGGLPRQFEETLVFPQGERTVWTSKSPLLDQDGQVIGLLGISRDISAQKQAEHALRESEERLRLLIEHAPMALALFDRDMRYLAVNQRWIDDFQVADPNMIGRCHYEVFPDLEEKWKEAHRRGLAGESVRCENDPYTRDDGAVIWTRWEVRPWRAADGAVGGIVIFAENVTDRMRAELALQESDARFRDIVEASADWVWEVDAQGRYTYVSESVVSLLGYTPAEILGKTPFDLMPAEEAERVRARFIALAAAKAPFRDLDNINLRKDGGVRHVWSNGMPILGADGAFLGYRGLDHDITEMRLQEQELRASEERHRVLFESSLDALMTMEPPDWGFKSANPAALRLFGVASLDRFIALGPWDLSPERQPDGSLSTEAARAWIQQAVREGAARFEWQHQRLGDGQFAAEVLLTRMERQGKAFIQASVRDISERKAFEEELKARNEELQRFNRASIGRELDMLEMKKTINALSRELGREAPYPLAFLNEDER